LSVSYFKIAKKLFLVDFIKGASLSGSKFVVYNHKGAKIIRALMNFMLKNHRSNGYLEH